MKQYQDYLQDVLDNGTVKDDRTGTGTISVFGRQLRFDLSEGFPLVTTKKVHLKSIIHELLWFLSGDTNVKYLQDNGVKIWDNWYKPYSINDEFVKVTRKKTKEYVPFDFNNRTNVPIEELDETDKKLYGIWKKMIDRCYNIESDKYKSYGAKGIFVDKTWFNPYVFINEVKNIPQWLYKLNDWNNFELDKDYYDAKYYSKETCVWLHKKENVPITDGIIITDSDGEEYIFTSIGEASRRLKMSRTSLHRFIQNGLPNTLKANNKHFQGWTFNYIDDTNDFVVRKKLIGSGELGPVYGHQWRNFGDSITSFGVDQITEAIHQLKNNPNSRRIVVTAWNPCDVEFMALPPCHMFFQFYVANGKLSCQMYQRSVDSFLGLPFNIASYALLTHMFAQQADLEVGEFVWTGGDCHIYLNHIDQVKLQLTREPYPLPQLKLNKANSMFEYKYEDFEILNYYSHPTIKGEISV